MISGKIIPAIATTTAAITGFIGVEMYKYIINAPLESHRAASLNLASNIFCVESLPDPQFRKSGLDRQTYMQVVAIPEKHTCWDNVVIDKPELTLQQFIDELAEGQKTKQKLGGRRNVDGICLPVAHSLCGSARSFLCVLVHHGYVVDFLISISGSSSGKVLFNSMDSYDASKKDAVAKRLATPVVDLWTEIVGPIFPADRKYLLFDCSVEDDSGNPGIVPTIRYNFRQ